MPAVYKKPLPYQFDREIAGVALMGTMNAGLIVRADAPYKTMDEFIAFARKNPGKVRHGNAGPTQLFTLTMGRFAEQQKIELLEVPYQGAVAIAQGLLTSSIDATFMELSSTATYIHSGKFRLLAVTGTERLGAFPEVPTFTEAGFKVVEGDPFWFGLVASSKVPQAIRQQLNAAVNEVLASPQMRDFYAAQSLKLLATTTNGFDEMVRKDMVHWAPIVKSTGITLE
jgi:tripartite-type tricarboxylate transporter receptor subunit TctC